MLTTVFLLIDFFLSLVLLLPLRDDRGRYRNFPFMTVSLIVSNVTAHIFLHILLPTWLGDDDTWLSLMRQMMLLPAGVLNGEGLGALSMITAAFMHADWSHLLGNMFFLFFFGRKLEDVVGPAKFGLFYLACVFVSGTGSVLGRAALPLTQGTTPGLGASGAVMGIVAAYLFLYQDQRIRTLPMVFGVIPIPFAVPMPAWVFILYTVLGDLARGWLRQEFETEGLIYSAVDSFGHLGGIIAGLTCLYFFLPQELMNYRHRPDLAR